MDYGHTLSPTIEMHALPELLHGEAVCIDMAVTTGISVHRGLMTREEGVAVLRVMKQLGLPTWNPVLAEQDLLPEAVRDATRHRDGQQRIPLTRGIGNHVFVNDVTDVDLAAGIDFIRTAAAESAVA